MNAKQKLHPINLSKWTALFQEQILPPVRSGHPVSFLWQVTQQVKRGGLGRLQFSPLHQTCREGYFSWPRESLFTSAAKNF